MNVRDLKPAPTNVEPFRRDCVKHVPAKSGCYVLTTALGHILYVGLATNLRGRFEQHLDNPEKTRPTPEGRALSFHWLETKILEGTERGWLNSHELVEGRIPVLNKVHSPVSL